MNGDAGRTERLRLEGLVHRARVGLRDWTDANDSDPGMALIELLAFVGDLLSSYSDRVADEAHLDTGRHRSSRRTSEAPPGHVHGVHAAVVVDNTDPLRRRRLLVQVPGLGDEAALWAMACLPDPGSTELPAPGQGVWVAFEAGDPSRPIWLGQRVSA